MPVSDYDSIFDAAGREWNVDPIMLRAMAQHESGGQSDAVSKKGAVGVMQIMPGTQTDLGITNPNDPAQSIFGAAKLMNQLLEKYGTPEKALAAYNAGPGRVDDFLAGKAQLPAETQAFIPSVIKNYQAMSAKAAPPAYKSPGPASGAVPDDDFLDSAGAKPGTAQTPAAPLPDDDFLSAAGAAPAKKSPSVAPPVGPLPNVSEYGDLAAQPWAQGEPPPPRPSPLGAAISRIAGATSDAWNNSPPGVTPAGEAAINRFAPLLGPTVYNPLLHAAGGAWAGVNALGAGVGAGVEELATAAGSPALGRDLNLMAQVAPFADMGAGMLRVPTEAPSLRSPRFAQEYYGEGTPANPLAAPPPRWAPNPLAAEVDAPAFIPPGSNIPPRPAEAPPFVPPGTPEPPRPAVVPPGALPPETEGPVSNSAGAPAPVPAGAPAPTSAGAAATPSAEAGMSPKQIAAYRATAEGQKLLETQQPGIRDATTYIPGVTPNAAEIEQTVNLAREMKSLNITAPDVSQAAKEIAAENNDARAQHFARLAGSDVDVMNAKAARSAQAESNLSATWANKKPADASPVIAAADQIIQSPDGKRPLVRNAVDAVTKELYDTDGNLETDPEMLYGVRKHVDDLMSREAGVDDPKSVRAFANLATLKSALDGVIENAAPGYRTYLENFKTASVPIDEMEALQKFEPKLYDAQNRMTYNKVQSMMRSIVDARQSSGINPYKSISDDTMNELWNLRDDLRRSAGAQELARTPGSDSVQNLWDVAKHTGAVGARILAHGAANWVAPVLGSVAVDTAEHALSTRRAARLARRLTERGMKLLKPDSGPPSTPP